MVDLARKQPTRRQTRIRKELVVLLGERPMRMAQELDDTNPAVTSMVTAGDQVIVPKASDAARGWFTTDVNADGKPMHDSTFSVSELRARPPGGRPGQRSSCTPRSWKADPRSWACSSSTPAAPRSRRCVRRGAAGGSVAGSRFPTRRTSW
ncbi:hypothetical protein [Streptomyces sp. TLI_105]|uniref:hypothetical protein n=1 Tax=Streptomyces sp. TLI_105 TaxID=1881019 RepID=UPI0015A4F11F|nr:hypothetical protein [Streptomyces sp. TLI_105]